MATPVNVGASDIKAAVAEKVSTVEHVGMRPKKVLASELLKDGDNLKEDIIRIILQYLENEHYHVTHTVLRDEANVQKQETQNEKNVMRRLRRAITEGSWADAEEICKRVTLKNYKNFLFELYKQQYLEQLEQHEYQKAYTLLTRKIKPLEHLAAPGQFKELCYLLSCNSLQESPMFKNWEGVARARERIVEQFEGILEIENHLVDREEIPPNRLKELLQQAVAYQIEFSRYHPKIVPKIETLLHDYTSFVVPNAPRLVLTGHSANVKCVTFVGDEGQRIASGSSDNTVRLWCAETGACEAVLEGHTSRIWDLASDASGSILASASADTTVKIWNIASKSETPACTLTGHTGDVYGVRIHPGQNHVVSGAYDQSLRLYDIRTGQCVKTFEGHDLGISSVTFNPHGNLIVSGAKDATVKFWDISSGLCVNTITAHMGEVSSVEIDQSGADMLVGSKDNSNRLWDMRMLRPRRRFRGHQNTSKNFIRCGFGPTRNMVMGGSEDGCIRIWDTNTGDVLQKLRGTQGAVYKAVWNNKQSLLASCGDDGKVTVWWYDETQPLFPDDD